MKNNRKSKIFIALLLVLTMLAAGFAAVYAETQEEIDAAHEAADQAKAATEAKKKEAKEAAKKAAAAVENLEAAEAELIALQGQIESTKGQISAKMAEIAVTQDKMEKKQIEIEDQNTALNNRLTAMYKTGTAGFVDVILNSENVEDLLTNVGMVNKILESDQNLLKKLQKDYKELKKIKKELEEQKAALENYEISLEGQETETTEIKARFQEEADRLKAMEDQLEAEAEILAAEAAEKQAAAEKMILDEGLQVDVAPGEWAWPTQGNWKITSNYGWRICPFHGKEFHNGVDIVLSSGTYGSPVYAIADGMVTRASWYGSYGNCVQVAHGNGYSSLYGHLKGFNCKSGQFVTKGTVIGYIGSTGNSTGPHLHFTVFNNGSHINPFSLY
ncbi:MAG: peptidoglycan DD-metalloendopeptidase family protein [Mogibacterium sp.]|nr:peptidoglycan DD-metalloendopeptidase family protein [Mogibacterium sp.]